MTPTGTTRGSAQVDFRPILAVATASSNATSATISAGAGAANPAVRSALVEPVRTLNITYDKQLVPGNETTYM